MKPIRWLTVRAVEVMQADLIRGFGGSLGVRDYNLLQSALDRGPNLHNYGGEESIPALAAAISWGLLKNHAFIDGNKRIALASLFTFLNLNGWDLSCSEAEETDMTLRGASSEITESVWIAWVTEVSKLMS